MSSPLSLSADLLAMPPIIAELYEQKIAGGELAPDPGQRGAVAAFDRLRGELIAAENQSGWRKFLKPAPAPKGLYLYGDVGRGKTMLMDLFFASLPDDLLRQRVHFHEFMLGVHDYLHTARKKHGQEAAFLSFARDLADRVRLLCFDEFHVTDIADAMILGRLFEALFARKVAIVTTSNWPPDRLYEGGLQRDRFLPFIDLIKERMQIVPVTGEVDYRMQCLREEGVYFQPLGRHAQKSADTVFGRLTAGAKPYDETLTVKGRNLHVETVAKGVARFTFAQLCERPLGAEDYLRIAKTYHTVFLENIPKMAYDRRNETKRFMTLIDALYDSRTKLVATAETVPEKLYTGHDYAFEFDRTVSRLIEMQSPDYLKATEAA